MFGLPKLGLMGIGLVTAMVANGMALAWPGTSAGTGLRRLPAARLCASNPVLRELWRLGLPIGGTYAVEVGLFAFAALCMGTMGSTQLAAHQIALQIVSVAFMVPAGMSYASPCASASTTAPGNCCGAHGRRVGIGFGAAVMLGLPRCSGCCRTTGRAVPRPQRPGVCRRDLAVQPAGGGGVVRAVRRHADHRHGLHPWLKDAKTTFLVGAGCYWLIGAPAAWWMAFTLGWGPTGVWWGLALGLACAAVSLTWRLRRR
jgi:MATE family multidrug resistance protein